MADNTKAIIKREKAAPAKVVEIEDEKKEEKVESKPKTSTKEKRAKRKEEVRQMLKAVLTNIATEGFVDIGISAPSGDSEERAKDLLFVKEATRICKGRNYHIFNLHGLVGTRNVAHFIILARECSLEPVTEFWQPSTRREEVEDATTEDEEEDEDVDSEASSPGNGKF